MSDNSTKVTTVLAVDHPDIRALVDSSDERVKLELVTSVDELIARLRDSSYDVVVAGGASISPLAGIVGVESSETILNRIGQGVAIVDRTGAIVWSNQTLRSYTADAIEKVRESCYRVFQELSLAQNKPEAKSNRRRSLKVGDDIFLDLTISGMYNADGELVEVVGLVWDTSNAHRLQDKIDAIDAAGRELVHLDSGKLEEMSVPERLEFLEERIINYSRDLMHFDHFMVRVLDKKDKSLDCVIADGFSEEAKSLDIYAKAEGHGISGYVAASGRSYICPDISKDPRYLSGLVDAKSSLTVPLMLHDEVVGILNVESNRVAAFSEHDRQFAEIFGRYVAIALHILKLLVVERHATTGQMAADVAHELSRPLNDIITDASNILEDFIGHDDLRKRLHAILDNVDLAKKTIAHLTEPRGVTGLMPESSDHDPVLSDKRILIAEDEDVIRETVSEVLTRAGAITMTADDGNDAITLLHQKEFDLVVTDIKMPHCSGYDVYAAAKAAKSDLPVIMVTGFGYDPDHAIVRASKEGLAGVLFKPFKVDDLLEAVRTALAPRS